MIILYRLTSRMSVTLLNEQDSPVFLNLTGMSDYENKHCSCCEK